MTAHLTALKLHDVYAKRGQRTILQEINLTFEAGQLTAIIGPNGAGKSTMLDIAAGLKKPSAGVVSLGGKDLKYISRTDLARQRAYLPQRAGVDWPITVERVVALGLTPELPAFGELPKKWKPALDAALSACHLMHLREREATQLSGGELARTMLARSIVANPSVLIVDEPTAGLDPRHALDAVHRLRTIADTGCSVIVAIHELELALNQADRIVALKEGQVLATGPTQVVISEALLSTLYDVPTRLSQDTDGLSVRFLGSGST